MEKLNRRSREMGVWRQDSAANGCSGILTICSRPGERNEIALNRIVIGKSESPFFDPNAGG